MIKSWLKRLSPSLQNRLRRFSRLRWLEKARLTRYYQVSFRARPWQVAKYVLWAPDVGDFSYELDNEAELVSFLASALALEPTQVKGYLDEIHTAPEVTHDLAATVRRRPDMKRRPGLGHRVAWYVVARAIKPQLVVETGIKHGLGALVLLVALERNAREGSDGRLISFDPDPESGWVVPEAMRRSWRPVFATSFDAFDEQLAGEQIDLFICDTPPDTELEDFEMHAALRHAAPGIVLIAGNGDRTTVLPDLAAERGGDYRFFTERPRHPIYPGGGLGLALGVRP
ncbi:MAG TPA: class I SAM-dependent methyltransferase [Solirubrobacteraceae bacterium]|nr:class I SAM-dependent methyltransferase [Solirubrobacteraceae bacterium]